MENEMRQALMAAGYDIMEWERGLQVTKGGKVMFHQSGPSDRELLTSATQMLLGEVKTAEEVVDPAKEATLKIETEKEKPKIFKAGELRGVEGAAVIGTIGNKMRE